jgi:hypothetical protein
MSLELSKEMLQVKGHLQDARVLVESVLGKPPGDIHIGYVVEVARMLQQEYHHTHKKTPVVKEVLDQPKASSHDTDPARTLSRQSARLSRTLKASTNDKVMTSARNNPQVPMLVSAPQGETTTRKRKPRPSKPTPKVKKAEPKPKKKASKPRRR